jgi:hypothetical protein
MKKTLIAFFIGLTSCGKPAFHDQAFSIYLSNFSSYYNVSVAGTTVEFETLEDDAVGVCDMSDNEIKIDPEYWYNADDYEKEELIYHELGHCVFNLEHNEDLVQMPNMPVGAMMPVSIMYPYTLDSTLYAENRDYYLAELKKEIAK